MRTLLVTATCAANVVISVVSTLLYYRELYALKTSPLFATQLNGAMQAAICGILLLALDCSGVAPRKSQPPVAMRRWLELAFWFALQNTLEIASIDGLGPAAGSLAAVLQQAVVPTTLLVSIVLVGRRYSVLHWASALVVVAGVATSFTAGASIPKIPWGWAATLVASRLPQAIANVRTEAALTSAEPAVRQELRSVLRAGFWTALFGLGFNVISGLLLTVARGEPPARMLDDYRTGALCLAPNGGCDGALSAVLAYAVPGVLFVVSEFAVVQQASASAYMLLVALQLPLVAVALSAKPFMGSQASPFRPALLIGVPIIVLGLGLWALAERRAARRRSIELESALLADGTSVPTFRIQN